MEYKTRVAQLLSRQMNRWGLADGMFVDVHFRLYDHLPRSPKSVLVVDRSLFQGEGMIYRFSLIDPANRLLVHTFRFQVFYHADEQTLVVRRGVHVTATGL